VIKNRDYEMVLFGNILDANFDLFPFWHSSERFYPGLNLSLYDSDKADELIDDIRQGIEKGDVIQKFQDLQTIITEGFPAAFLYSPDYLFITDKNLKGVSERFITEPADRFSGINLWHLKTVRVLR